MKKIGLLFLSCFLIGCATNYQKQGLLGGFDETQLAPNVWAVKFKGNDSTSINRAEEFTLLRCADLALQHGYLYFVLTESTSSIERSTYTSPRETTTTFESDNSADSTRGTVKTKIRGGNTEVISSPLTSYRAVMYQAKPDLQDTIYDAQFLCHTLGKKYEIECGTLK